MLRRGMACWAGLVLGALSGTGCADERAPTDLAGEAPEGEPSDLSGVRVIGAALTASNPNLGETYSGTPATSFATTGEGANVLTITLNAAAPKLLLGFDRASKAIRVNNQNVPCLSGCKNGRGAPIDYVSIDPRATTSLKRVEVVLAGAPETDHLVVIDHRSGGLFLPGTASGPGVRVQVATGTRWFFGFIGSLRADSVHFGADGVAINRDDLVDLVWRSSDEATSPQPQLAVAYTEAGNDTITGSGASGLLPLPCVGGPAPYPLEVDAGPGRDKASGGLGDDLLYGGLGDDQFIIEPGVGASRTTPPVDPTDPPLFDGRDTLNGNDGVDTVDYSKVEHRIVAVLGESWVPVIKGQDVYYDRCDGADLSPYKHRMGDGRVPAGYECHLTGNGACVTEDDNLAESTERVLGTPQGDLLVGGCQTSLLFGRGGADTLIAGAKGGGSLYGEAGDDTLNAGFAPNGRHAISGGAGRDTLLYSYRQHDVNFIAVKARPGSTGPNGAVVDGVSEGDTGGSDSEVIQFGPGDDTIVGGNASETLYAGEGNDSVNGGKGNDIIYGQGGFDVLRGATGNDILIGGLGADYLFGDGGANQFHGDRGMFCRDADPPKLCATDADCGGEPGSCTYDRFCPPEGRSCNDFLVGSLGNDRFHLGTDAGREHVDCGEQRNNRDNDVLLYDKREAVVVASGPDRGAQAGYADSGSDDLSEDRDELAENCETLTPPPASVLAVPEGVQMGANPPTLGSYRVGEAVQLWLKPLRRSDVRFAFSQYDPEGHAVLLPSEGGQLLRPRLWELDDAVGVIFVPSEDGRFRVTAELTGADGATTGWEVDIEVATPTCDTSCELPSACDTASDLCVLSNCHDGLQNGEERGPDCGGSCERECQPSCRDGLLNGLETGVDCGGPRCGPCPSGEACQGDSDCAAGVTCDGGMCVGACDNCEVCGEGGACEVCPPELGLFNGRCVASCPGKSLLVGGGCACQAGHYPSGSECVACLDATCLACDPGGLCKVGGCADGYALNAAGRCVPTSDQTLCPALDDARARCLCPDGQAGDPKTGLCVDALVPGCPAPYAMAVDGSRWCGCREGTFRKHDGTCGACPANCASCANDGQNRPVCLACTPPSAGVPGALFFDGACTLGCPLGSVPREGLCVCQPGTYLADGRCASCGPGCGRCDDGGFCAQCQPGFGRLDGLCVPVRDGVVQVDGAIPAAGGDFTCTQPLYATRTPEGVECRECKDPGCLKCRGPGAGQCEVCRSGSFLVDGQCLDGCGGGEVSEVNGQCACEAPKFMTWEYDESGGILLACGECNVRHCDACASAFMCQDGGCAAGFENLGGLCFPTANGCAPGESQNVDGLCVPCAPVSLIFAERGFVFAAGGHGGYQLQPAGLATYPEGTVRQRLAARGAGVGEYLPSQPSLDSHTFVGFWHRLEGVPRLVGKHETLPSCSEPFPYETVVLEPAWLPLKEDPDRLLVGFFSAGGSLCPPLYLPVGATTFKGALGCTPTPPAPGVPFLGWFDRAQGSPDPRRFTAESQAVTSGSIILYAHWDLPDGGDSPCPGLADRTGCINTVGCFWASDGTCDACSDRFPGCAACAFDGSTCKQCLAGQVRDLVTGGCHVAPACDAKEYSQCLADVTCAWNGAYCVPKCHGAVDSACSATPGCWWNGCDCKPCGSSDKGTSLCQSDVYERVACREGWAVNGDNQCAPICSDPYGYAWFDGACRDCASATRYADRYSGRCVSECPVRTASVSDISSSPSTNTCESCPVELGCATCISFTNVSVNGHTMRVAFGCNACPSGHRLDNLGSEGVQPDTLCVPCGAGVTREVCEATESSLSPTGQACGGSWSESGPYCCPTGTSYNGVGCQ